MESQMGKNWVFTLNNPEDKDLQVFKNFEVTYILISLEVGEEGTPHYQGCVQFTKNKRLTGLKKLHPRAHWEMMRGTFKDNEVYIKKVDSKVVLEFGSAPKTRQQVAESLATQFSSNIRFALDGQFEEIDPVNRVRYYNTWKRIRMDRDYDTNTLDGDLLHEWVWGPTGTGKSLYARGQGVYYDKLLNKWWDDYQDEDIVIIEEYHPEAKLNHYMKKWCDRYPFRAEYKGGSRLIRPRKIIVTSNYSLEQCFFGVDLEAVKRRFKVIHKTN